MKADPIAKMYEGLNGKEQALLAFKYLTANNKLEMLRVGDAVPSHKYICKDYEFTKWYDNFFNLAALWSVEHWKAYAIMLEVRVDLLRELRYKNNEEVMPTVKKFGRMEARLLAVDAAMLAVFNEHGIDPTCAYLMAGSEAFTPESKDMIPDANYQAEMHKNFSCLLTGEQ